MKDGRKLGEQFHLASQANFVSEKEMSGWMRMSP